MYAVIRAGGKQYQVAPGDVIRVEKVEGKSGGQVEFTEVLAVSPAAGQISRPQGARVVGRVVEQGRADKILVFHLKRKKQYKKLAGHRQPFTAVRITEIAFDGQKFTAAEEPEKVKKAKPEKAARPAEPKAEAKAHAKPHAEHKETKHAEAKKHAPAHKAEHGDHGKKAAKKPKKK